MIHVTDLVFEYPTKRALNEVSLTIPKGSLMALVGPNGAGKTTLLKCLSGLVFPVAGKVMVDGLDITKHPREVHKKIGYLPDFFGLYDELTVEQALVYFCMAYQLEETRIPERIKTVAEQINLVEKLQAKVGSLSRGMRQRLAIGQAIIHEPTILFLDEPASGLDPEARHELGKLFVYLNKQGMTLVISSHILAELDEYARDLIVLRHGAIIQQKKITHAHTSLHKTIVCTLFEKSKKDLKKLKASTFIDRITIKKNTLLIDFSGDTKAQHSLLKYLLKEGVPIKDFYEKKINLQEQYMAMVKE